MCVCVCVCVTSPKWRCGGHEVAGEQQFSGDSHGSGAFSADRRSCVRLGHTLESARPLPVGSRCRFFVFDPVATIEAQQSLRSVGPPPVSTTLHHTPWGLLRWQSDRTTTHGHYRLRWPVYLTRLSTVISTTMARSCHSPQGCRVWAWPAHLCDSLSASETGPRQ